MQKARLTGRQGLAAIIAGIVGHVLFAAGWLSLGFVLLGGGLTLLLGGTVGGVSELFGDVKVIVDFLADAGAIIGVVVAVLAAGSIVMILLAALFSVLILKAGAVRKAGAVTWTAILVCAVIDVPLLILWLVLSSRFDHPLLGPLVAVGGTAVVGALIWLWMTWLRRGPASAFAGVGATSEAAVAAVPAASAAPADSATRPVSAKATATVPAPKKPGE